jgi:hypothetical protein
MGIRQVHTHVGDPYTCPSMRVPHRSDAQGDRHIHTHTHTDISVHRQREQQQQIYTVPHTHTQAYTAVPTISDSACVMRVGACLQPGVWRLAAAQRPESAATVQRPCCCRSNYDHVATGTSPPLRVRMRPPHAHTGRGRVRERDRRTCMKAVTSSWPSAHTDRHRHRHRHDTGTGELHWYTQPINTQAHTQALRHTYTHRHKKREGACMCVGLGAYESLVSSGRRGSMKDSSARAPSLPMLLHCRLCQGGQAPQSAARDSRYSRSHTDRDREREDRSTQDQPVCIDTGTGAEAQITLYHTFTHTYIHAHTQKQYA